MPSDEEAFLAPLSHIADGKNQAGGLQAVEGLYAKASNVGMLKGVDQSCWGAGSEEGSCSQDKVPKQQSVWEGPGAPVEFVSAEAVAVKVHSGATLSLLLYMAGFAAGPENTYKLHQMTLKYNELSLSEGILCVEII